MHLSARATSHQYHVTAAMEPERRVRLESEGAPLLESAGPKEFGGPGDRWSPEALLVGAVADCYLLTFEALARRSKLPYRSIRCGARGTLDKSDGRLRFVSFELQVELQLEEGADRAKAERLLHKAEQHCLVSASLTAPVNLRFEITVG